MPDRGALEKSFDPVFFGCGLMILVAVVLLVVLGYFLWRALGGGWT